MTGWRVHNDVGPDRTVHVWPDGPDSVDHDPSRASYADRKADTRMVTFLRRLWARLTRWLRPPPDSPAGWPFE